jgi:tetratricopeptide (TPR) repeat protein
LYGTSQMAYADGDYQSGLDASQKAVHLFRQVGDRFNLAFALCATGNMAAYQNDMAQAEQALAEAILVGREMESHVILSYALGVLSDSVALPRGDFVAARRYAEESMFHSRETGLTWGVGRGEQVLARIAKLQGDWDEAKVHALAALDISREQHDPLLLSLTYNELGDISLLSGSLVEAQHFLEKCIVAFQQIGQKAFVAHELESFAFIARRQNQPERTARLLSAAEAVREGVGTSVLGIERLEAEFEGAVSWLKAQLDEAAFNTLWSEGCAMSMDQAVAYALEG